MKRLLALAAMSAMAAAAGQAKAADLDYQPAIQQLVVSGMLESWVGYTFHTGVNVDDGITDYFVSGRSGRLSLPLGTNLSLQMDVDNELNSDFLVGSSDIDDNFMDYTFQGLVHLSARDPARGLIGAFGGAGKGHADTTGHDFFVVGGEAQAYLDNLTFYAQGGYIDSEESGGDTGDGLREAGFGRGVIRWFTTENSRLQAEVSYAEGLVNEDDDGHLFEWAARYDTMLALPIVGDSNVFIGYRGAHFENDDNGAEYTDHTVMAGFRVWFGGNSLLEFDRVGATLDAPNFGRWVGSGNIID